MKGFRSLCIGEPVEFETAVKADGRIQAVKVTGPNGAEPQGAPREQTQGAGRGGNAAAAAAGYAAAYGQVAAGYGAYAGYAQYGAQAGYGAYGQQAAYGQPQAYAQQPVYGQPAAADYGQAPPAAAPQAAQGGSGRDVKSSRF